MIHRTLEIKVLEINTEARDRRTGMTPWSSRRYVRVDVSDIDIPGEKGMQSVAFQAKMEYARQSLKSKNSKRSDDGGPEDHNPVVNCSKIKLSKPQQVALKTCYEHQNTLRRWPGVFWTYPGAKKAASFGFDLPEWSTSIATVRCLEHKGLMERALEYEEEWRDTRITTPLGRKIASMIEVKASV
jgi:hypothetical protein